MSTSSQGAGWLEAPTADGSWTLYDPGLGEACHSRSGAWQQATQRYALGCRLETFAGNARVCRLLDVGTGLGLNLAAALWALEGRAVLEVVTLEADPSVIEHGIRIYAREALRSGPWDTWHAPVRRALTAALAAPGERVPLGAGFLELRLGDARRTLQDERSHAPPDPFDAVFLDPFSPRRAPELWQEDFLRSVAARMAPRAWLATYSASFRVRLALHLCGLRVGLGPRVGTKSAGTLASPELEPPAFPGRIARRLERQGAPPVPSRGAFLAFGSREGAPAFD